jgi:SagB-type dehydrogenase family enzyme
MSDRKARLRERFPLTWAFQRNTSRWTFNTLSPSVEDTPEPPRELLAAEYTALPEPVEAIGGLLDAIRERHSCRQFAVDPVRLSALSTLLRYAYGVIGESSFGALPFYERPVPSGGGMYPLDLYLIANRVEGLAAGVYRYAPVTHGLELAREGAMPTRFLTYLCMGQSYAGGAPLLIVIGANFLRSMKKYGDRGYRYIYLEAGHVAQNINLLSFAIGLGNCDIGGFFDVELASLLRMDIEEEAPLYVIAVGVPTHADREESRSPE